MELWTVRYKKQGPYEQAVIRASTEAIAREVAEAWCARERARLIFVHPFCVADESILIENTVALESTQPPTAQVTAPAKTAQAGQAAGHAASGPQAQTQRR